jgi:ABC-type branched-subunit amino acid transport system ATPase component
MVPLLQFTDVELYYDHVYALKGVSLDVNDGETVESSAAKSISGVAGLTVSRLTKS